MWHVRRGVGTPHVRATCRRVPKTRQNLEIKEYTCYKGQYNALSTQEVFAKKKILRLKSSTGAFSPSRYDTSRKTTQREPFWSAERQRDRYCIFFFATFLTSLTHPPTDVVYFLIRFVDLKDGVLSRVFDFFNFF